MNRAIVGFHRDEEGHWVVELDCGHGQHVRDTPPFVERPWVHSAAERRERIGGELACALCERAEVPAGYEAQNRTPVFDEGSVPAALTSTHSTKAGVWGLIHVERGRLEYHVHAPAEKVSILDPRHPGIVLPEVEHHVSVIEAVRFFVEFWRPAS